MIVTVVSEGACEAKMLLAGRLANGYPAIGPSSGRQNTFDTVTTTPSRPVNLPLTGDA
ncbi:hypothetical protein FHS02_001462 [Massilia umbonata]|uniref:Uncharacterized protein n=1 Tax=Pseudoduganella umbonata TaxID=864828 RepID=A0A7W5HBL0_9BURK|nr:hypothetical protein [Pseudoduganella umbonata]